MRSAETAKMDLVREAFHYQSRFAGSTMVFKIDFPVTQASGFSPLMNDLALLARTGFRVVIIPGAKEWIGGVLAKYGIVTDFIVPETGAFPLRRTTEAAMPFVEMAAFHTATRFMTALSASRTDSVIGSFVRARGLGVLNGVDMEHTGRVEKILTMPIGRILDSGTVPILPCIGWGPSGKSYNVSSDELALAASAALGAIKLFIVSAGPGIGTELTLPEGVETAENGKPGRLTPAEAEAILELNLRFRPEMQVQPDALQAAGAPAELSRLDLALAASKAGVERIHLVDGREEGAVLGELFSNLGSGTMIYADEYEAVRPLKTGDIPGLLRIMKPLVRQGVLIPRSPGDILDKKEDFFVFGIDGRAHACGALHCWGNQGEIAALAVDPAYADRGLGSRMLRFLINKAKKDGLVRVFLLTTKTQDWFESFGFRESGPDVLPAKRAKNYDGKRNSKVFVLEL
jgi:amino-acid N-acetyltransferase